MNLAAYLARIGLDAAPRPDIATLRAIHIAHARSIAFENLDVQLRRPVSMDIEAIYDKLVDRRRGGWCYEQNGLIEWALREIGFDVVRLCAGVMREIAGDAQLGNHLCLRVTLERAYLVDVGFGGSLIEPLPLAAGERHDSPYRVSLGAIGAGYWRFSEQAEGDPFSFDFRDAAADESLLAARCAWQQSDPGSPFVRNLVVQQRKGNAHITLRGRVLKRNDGVSIDKTILATADELVGCLHHHFQLEVPEARDLWPEICARHSALFEEGG